MYLPEINKRSIKRKRVDCFKGINRGKTVDEGELSDTCNLSARAYPTLSAMPVRYELDSYLRPTVGIPRFFLNRDIFHIAPMREDAPTLHSLYKGDQWLLNFDFYEDISKENIVNFNSKTLLIKKDKAFEFDPMNPSPMAGLAPMGRTLEIEPARINPDYNQRTAALSVIYGDMIEPSSFYTGSEDTEFPNDAEEGAIFAKYLEYYRLIHKDTDPEKNIWQSVTSVRLRLEVGDGYRYFREGDYVRLKDLKYWNWSVRHFEALDRFVRIEKRDEEGRYITEEIPVFDDMDKILAAMSYPTNDIGYSDIKIDNPGNLQPLIEGSVSACMPPLDLICTGANRVWGCSNSNREIYASELGNARNFSVFEGLSGDSYAVSVGSPGDFTACCNYLGSPVFFKESEMIVISGSRPAAFTLNSYSVRGVPAHSPDGLCVTGDVLYYISSDGVYAYNGASAVCISHDLGDDIRGIRSAVLFGEGEILYVSGLVEDKPVQYIYDIKRHIWHRAETDRIIGCVSYPDATLAVSFDGRIASLITLDKGIPYKYELIGARELTRDWSWETGDISYSTDKKYLRKLSLDTSCDEDSRLYISYDGEDFTEIGRFGPHIRGSNRITVFPRRCDYFRLRMEGSGAMTLYALTKETEEVRENG